VNKKLKSIFPILLITILPTLALWLPFALKIKNIWSIPLTQMGMGTIVANYDGPLYIVVAKTLYAAEAIKANYSFPLPVEYYAAHFPLFPLLIRLFAPIMGYPYSMLFVTIFSSFVGIYYFYLFIQDFVDKKEALFVTLLFAIFPARWLISRSVGSADPLFVTSILASIYHFRKKKYLPAGIWGAVAQLTKSAGILLFATYAIVLAIPKIKKLVAGSLGKWIESLKLEKTYPLFLLPLALIGVFTFYYFTYGDFFAYFKSGDNIHLFFPPFQIFDYSQPWVGTFWLEEIIFVYLIGGLGLMKLIKMKEEAIYWFVGIFFVSLLFVSHRDIIRYALPIIPFLYAAFSETITKKEFKIVALLIVIPIYLFSLSFISQNVMPISDWAPLL
jgi:hypothetical protein